MPLFKSSHKRDLERSERRTDLQRGAQAPRTQGIAGTGAGYPEGQDGSWGGASDNYDGGFRGAPHASGPRGAGHGMHGHEEPRGPTENFSGLGSGANYSQHGMGSGQPIIRPTSQVAQGGMSTTAGRGGYNREIAGSGNGPSGGRITGKIESALGSAVGSESLQAKGLQKQREAEAIKLQAAELSEAERLEEEARMRRQRAVGHGAHPDNMQLGGGRQRF